MAMRFAVPGVVLAVVMGWGIPATAHHSSSMFEFSPIWTEGTIVRFDRINPHAIVTLEEKDNKGQVRRYAIEGPSPVQLDRRVIAQDFLKTGDVVRFCTFPLKEEFVSRYSTPGADGVPQRFVHGHVLIRNGQKSMWGSYGNLGECIRSSDEPRQAWLDFLNGGARGFSWNSDLKVRDVWCQQRTNSTRTTTAMKAFVEEINKLLISPCQ